MKKIRLFILLLMAFFMPLAMQAQEIVEIGDSTGNTYMVPFNSLYGYSFTEQIFLADEIEMSGTITSVSFYLNQTYSSAQTNNIVLYMKNVDRETFTATTDWEEVTTNDIVFSGQWTIPADVRGWITLDLSTPFQYDGTSNLMIAMHEYTSGYNTRYFVCTSVTNSGISFYSDSANPDPYNLSSYSGSKALRSNRNKLQLTITPSGGPQCIKPTTITVDDITKNSANVTWHSEGTLWNLQYKLSSDANWTEVNGLTDTLYSLSGLSSNKTYNVKVQNVCDDTTASGWRSTNFTTRFAMPFLEEFPTTAVPTGWTRLKGWATLTSETSGWSFGTSSGVFDSHTKLQISGSDCKHRLVTPSFMMEDNVQLTFDLALTKSSGTLQPVTAGGQADDWFAVLVWNDTDSTWTTIRRWDNTGSANVYDNIATAGEEVAIDLSSYAGQNIKLAFYGESTESNGSNYLHIDNVMVDYIPTCTKPNNVTVSNVTATSVTVDWTENNTPAAAGWTILANGVEFPATTHPFTLTGLTPDTVYTVKVRANCSTALADTSYWSHYVNFTTPPTCPKPTNLTCESFTATSAVLTWSAGGEENNWIVEYSTSSNFANATSVDVEGDTTTEITGLTADATCYVRVKAACSVNDSSVWSNTINFTPTATITLTINEGTTTNSYVPIYGLYAEHNTHSQFIIPASSLTDMQWGEIRRLTFYCSQSSITWGTASFKVYMKEVGTTEMTSTTPDYSSMIEVYSGSLSVSNNQMVVNLNTPFLYNDGNLMIGFDEPVSGSYSSSSWYGVTQTTNTAIGGYDGTVSYRQFLPKTTFNYLPGEAPTCFAPTLQPASEITTTTATLTWSNNNEDTPAGYVIMVNDVELPNVNITDTTYTLTGLNPSTQYIVKVKAVCSEIDSSFWSYPISFATSCVPATSISEDFENAANDLPVCWDNVGAGTIAIQTTNPHSGSKSLKFSGVTGGNIVALPELEEYNGRTLTFYTRPESSSSSCGSFQVGYITDITNASTFHALETYQYNDAGFPNYAEKNVDLSTVPAGARLAFNHNAAYSNYFWFVDDINVPIPCPIPTNVTVDQNYVVRWETNGAIRYNVIVVVGNDTVIQATSTTGIYTITSGLNNGDQASVYVQSVCAEDDLSLWSEPATFTYIVEGVGNYNIQANIFPNPTTGNVIVESNAVNADITVYDMFGKLMMTSKVTSTRTELDLSGFAPGVYMVRIANSNAITTVKVVKE